jgi:multiple sugar transport system ATP-binding protein
MAFPLRAREMPADVMRSRIQDVAAKLRITELLQRRPAQLSGGQQQRVALGRAMVREPRMFLMDEPLTNLDFKLRVEMRAELKRLQKELGATFFYVTNDQVEAMSMADRIAILSQGVLQQIDSPETIYTRPANLFVAGFVGSPRMNFLDCVFDPATRALVADDQTWQMPLSPAQINMLERSANGGGYVLGLRAENVEPVWESAPGVIPGQVYVVEPLGDRTLVDIKIGASMIKAKVPPTFAAQTGESLGVRFDHERFSLFNKSTGEVVL